MLVPVREPDPLPVPVADADSLLVPVADADALLVPAPDPLLPSEAPEDPDVLA